MAVQKGGIQHFSVQEAHNINLGQGGSVFLDTDGTTFTPATGVVIAISMLTDVRFDVLTPEDGTKMFGIGVSGWESKGDTLGDTDTFPEGITIFGRWTSVSVMTSNQLCICYMGS